MSISVVVASYNQIRTLPLTLASLSMQTKLPDAVIVADDGSSDGTQQWLDSVPDFQYPFRLSYSTGRHELYGLTVSENRGASFIHGGRILFTNADMVHCPDSVASHASMIPNVIGGGRVKEVRSPESDDVDVEAVMDFPWFVEHFGKVLSALTNEEFVIRDPAINIYGVWGGNFSMDANRFHVVGGFNEEYRGLYGGEEADLIKRFQKMGGFTDWVYNSVAYHLGHKPRAYRLKEGGIMKYRREYLR